ncbi:MAG: transposon-transfer assisting family protein [Eubacteriales bacterium]|nr:transposon-transfer assisting family protein [Eubacteriales bacterium]
MNYSVEEINLMCIYDCSNRFTLLDELEEALLYVTDEDMILLIETVMDKLFCITDEEFSKLPLYPAWEEEGVTDAKN